MAEVRPTTKIKRPNVRRVSPSTVAAALGADFDHLCLSCCKPARGGNLCEFNGSLSHTGGLSIVMASDSGHIVLDESSERMLRTFLTRRHRRATRANREGRCKDCDGPAPCNCADLAEHGCRGCGDDARICGCDEPDVYGCGNCGATGPCVCDGR